MGDNKIREIIFYKSYFRDFYKVQKEDVKSMVQNGDALVITLKNGETIVIDNFFNNENNKMKEENKMIE